MSSQGIIMTIIAACMMGSSSLMLKASLEAMGGLGNTDGNLLQEIFKLATQPLLIIGVIIYGSATLLWLRVLSGEPISVGYPILVSLAFLIVTLGAVVIFKEDLNTVKLAGMGIILFGVFVLANG